MLMWVINLDDIQSIFFILYGIFDFLSTIGWLVLIASNKFQDVIISTQNEFE